MSKEQEIYNRVLKVVKTLREECGMSYEQIQVFWKNCIKEAKENAKTH